MLSPTPTLLLPSAAAPDASLSLPAYLAVVVVIAVGVRWLAWAVRVPSLLLLLPAGFALGQVVTPDTVMGRDVVSAAASVGVVVAVGFSVPVGFALGAAVRRHWVPDYLQGVLFLAVAVAALVGSNLIADEAGLLMVTVLGVVLGNQRGLRLTVVREFQEHTATTWPLPGWGG